MYSVFEIMGTNRGGGGQGDNHVPHDLEDGGHSIKCPPPPPPPRFWGWMIINWKHTSYILSGVVDLFFWWLVREVCDVRWVPLLCVWKIEQNMLRSGKRVSDSPPPPPPTPPPPRSSAFFSDLRDFRGWRRTWEKTQCVPSMIRFGFAPLYVIEIIFTFMVFEWSRNNIWSVCYYQ